jgi:hypothetical protein
MTKEYLRTEVRKQIPTCRIPGKCIECKIYKKIQEETKDLDFEHIKVMEYEETHLDHYEHIVYESSNYIDEAKQFDYDENCDEINLSDSSIVTQDNEVFMASHNEEEVSDDVTISIEFDSYEECHRGVCESCHQIGIVETTCDNCNSNECASIVKITLG